MAWSILLQDTYVPSVRTSNTNTLDQITYSVTYGNITRTKTETIPYFATFSTSAWKEVGEPEGDECAYDQRGLSCTAHRNTPTCRPCVRHDRIFQQAYRNRHRFQSRVN